VDKTPHCAAAELFALAKSRLFNGRGGTGRLEMEEPGAAEAVEGALDRIVREHMLPFQLHLAEFMGAHLSDCCTIFDGDLQEMLVFTIVAQRYLRERLAQPGADAQRRPVSAARIAAQTGVPRETVRRKLLSLEARGWVEKAGRSGWRVAVADGRTRAAIGLDDFLHREVRRTVKFAHAVKAYL
jgi:DNA-binding transcriptional regulator YhcF (GntR family)